MDGVRIPAIVGPTAAGKSAIAMALAAAANAAIVSADSRQVYRGFDVGTSKPTRHERSRVVHYLLDVAEPNERYSAARWAEAARHAIAASQRERRSVLLVGGTGFYLKALAAPLFQEPPLDSAQRAELFETLNGLSTSDLRAQVQVLDPHRAHLGRAQLLRALEVVRLTGVPISEWHARSPRQEQAVALEVLVVDRSQTLHERIATRVSDMLACGWVAEVERLAATIPRGAPAWNATGYSVVRDLAEGTISPSQAQERIVISTRQYAKRQRTWFRHQLLGRVTRVDLDAHGAEERIGAWWHEASLGTI